MSNTLVVRDVECIITVGIRGSILGQPACGRRGRRTGRLCAGGAWMVGWAIWKTLERWSRVITGSSVRERGSHNRSYQVVRPYITCISSYRTKQMVKEACLVRNACLTAWTRSVMVFFGPTSGPILSGSDILILIRLGEKWVQFFFPALLVPSWPI